VDVLVNNAATNPLFGPFLDSTATQWDRITQVNLRGASLLCQREVPRMNDRRAGSTINIASIEGLHPSRGTGIFSISKGAGRRWRGDLRRASHLA
jgi:dehydrogenase/reductase SDR family protein 4